MLFRMNRKMPKKKKQNSSAAVVIVSVFRCEVRDILAVCAQSEKQNT